MHADAEPLERFFKSLYFVVFLYGFFIYVHLEERKNNVPRVCVAVHCQPDKQNLFIIVNQYAVTQMVLHTNICMVKLFIKTEYVF